METISQENRIPTSQLQKLCWEWKGKKEQISRITWTHNELAVSVVIFTNKNWYMWRHQRNDHGTRKEQQHPWVQPQQTISNGTSNGRARIGPCFTVFSSCLHALWQMSLRIASVSNFERESDTVQILSLDLVPWRFIHERLLMVSWSFAWDTEQIYVPWCGCICATALSQ